jgi:hypothetical protein
VGGEVRGNYATLNPLNNPGGSTLSNGNLDCVTSSSLNGRVVGSIAVSSGKWYWEMLATNVATDLMVGISAASEITATTIPTSATTYLYYNYTGNKYNNGSNSAYGATYTTNDLIGVALDLDAGTIVFYKNGTSQGTAFSSLSGTFVPAFADGGTGTSGFTANFGQRAFAYTAPSGFKALCTTNLPAPLVTKSNTVMDAVLYTGTGTTNSITGLQFAPDFVWIKSRSSGQDHNVFDAVRGPSSNLYALQTNATSAEGQYGTMGSLDSTGFTLTGAGGATNASGTSYVTWAWDAGTSTVSNTQGSITSQVRANPTAGFSVVTYTGTGSNATVGHGLGVAPQMLIVKSRNNATDWGVYHQSVGNTAFMKLNTTGTPQSFNAWASTTPTSTVFSVGNIGETNTNGGTYVCYAFAPVVGYSAAFSYSGNGSSDGPFCFLGFRPRFIIQKRTDSTGSWLMIDTARDPMNVARNELFTNSSIAEADNTSLVDVLSNGFKIRATFANMNASGGSFIGYAFAEAPFNYSRAR